MDDPLMAANVLDTILQLLMEVHAQTTRILAEFRSPPATGIRLSLPIVTVKGTTKMADFPLLNDRVYSVPIQAINGAGAVEPDPNDVFTAVSASPSLGAAIAMDASGNPMLVLTPMVQAGTGYLVSVSDQNNLKAVSATFDIVQDTTPVALQLDLADATSVPQPVPAAPGP
jgi:hypothetical protein